MTTVPTQSRGVVLLLAFVMAVGCATPAGVHPREAYGLTPPQAFLWTHPYSKLSIEIYHAPGLATSPLALDALVEALVNLTGKEIVSIQQYKLQGAAAEKRERSGDELMQLAEENSQHSLGRGQYGHNDTAVLHIYYLLGDYDQGAFGVAIDGRAFLFFDDYDPANARPLIEDRAERRVLIHETGHVLGLVNSGIPMIHPREDPEDPGHSRNPDSVMSAGQIPLWPPDPMRFPEDRFIPYHFDAHDLEDVMAFRASQPTVPPEHPAQPR